MTKSKLNSLISNLNARQVKVFEVIPITAAWEINKVFAELKRKGINWPLGDVQGVLNALVNAGVIDVKNNRYMRIPVTEAVKVSNELQSDEKVLDKNFNLEEALKDLDKLKEACQKFMTYFEIVTKLTDQLGLFMIEQNEKLDNAIKNDVTNSDEYKAFLALKSIMKG